MFLDIWGVPLTCECSDASIGILTDQIYPWLQQDPVFELRINKYYWHVSGQPQAERSALWLRLTLGNEFSIFFSQTVNDKNIFPFASQQPENTPPPTPPAKAQIGLTVYKGCPFHPEMWTESKIILRNDLISILLNSADLFTHWATWHWVYCDNIHNVWTTINEVLYCGSRSKKDPFTHIPFYKKSIGRAAAA